MSNQLQLAKNFALALFFDASPVSNYFDIQFDRTEDERRENVCVFQRGQKSEREWEREMFIPEIDCANWNSVNGAISCWIWNIIKISFILSPLILNYYCIDSITLHIKCILEVECIKCLMLLLEFLAHSLQMNPVIDVSISK